MPSVEAYMLLIAALAYMNDMANSCRMKFGKKVFRDRPIELFKLIKTLTQPTSMTVCWNANNGLNLLKAIAH